MNQVIVNVHLKGEILDPQGRAVQGALSRFGLTELADVRQGKQFILTFADEVTASKLGEIEKVAATLLCNPVIEDFTIEVKE
jgi:phosphoribosylformylglycinamidine synthase